jgi:oxygen-independent coproporphyrinogen-3 oxidase
METSLYIHIPFCRRRCIYCDFYSVIHEESLAASYIDVVSSEIRNLKKRFSTIYIGGGTPTALGMSALSRVL